jgi:hypothetical protein
VLLAAHKEIAPPSARGDHISAGGCQTLKV